MLRNGLLKEVKIIHEYVNSCTQVSCRLERE